MLAYTLGKGDLVGFNYVRSILTPAEAPNLPLRPVTFAVPAPQQYGLVNVPNNFLPVRHSHALHLHDLHTGIYFVIRPDAPMAVNLGFFWDAEIDSPCKACPTPTTKDGWIRLSVLTAPCGLRSGYEYRPTIIPGLDRQPYSPESIELTAEAMR